MTHRSGSAIVRRDFMVFVSPPALPRAPHLGRRGWRRYVRSPSR